MTANQNKDISKTTPRNECDSGSGRIGETSGLPGTDSRDAGDSCEDVSSIRQSCYGMTLSCSVYRTMEQIRR
jgi:hypothetical protein